MKFKDTKMPTGFVQDEGTEVGTYSKEYLERQLHELYEIKKTIDRDIKIAEQKLKMLKEGRLEKYTKYPLDDVR